MMIMLMKMMMMLKNFEYGWSLNTDDRRNAFHAVGSFCRVESIIRNVEISTTSKDLRVAKRWNDFLLIYPLRRSDEYFIVVCFFQMYIKYIFLLVMD